MKKLSLAAMNAYFDNEQKLIADGRNLIAAGEQNLETLRGLAKEAGLARELHAREHPKVAPPPQWEETTRVHAVRSYSEMGRTPYGPELYEAHAGSVVDLPLSLVQRLGAAVEKVAADTPLRQLPLSQDDRLLLAAGR